MKTLSLLRNIGLSLILMILTTSSISAQITSWSSGGVWSDPATWIGGVVPTSTHDVLINGPVSVNGSYACKNLTIASGSSLTNTAINSYQLTVNGDLVNYGTISNGVSYLFTIYLLGDVTQNGIMNNWALDLIGSSDQEVTVGAGKTISTNYFTVTDSMGAIKFLSDSTFLNSQVNFNEARAVMSSNTTLALDGGFILDMDLRAKGNEVNSSNFGYFTSCTLDKVVVTGEFQSMANTFTDWVINNGIIENRGVNNYAIDVAGDITNNGTIENGTAYVLYMNVQGNIVNNGNWTNQILNLNGTGDQYISQGLSKQFSNYYFNNVKTSGDVYASSDL